MSTIEPHPQHINEWHQRSAEETLAILQASRAGLADEEAARRRTEYGPNTLESAPPRSKWRMVVAQFTDFTVIILLVAALIAGLLGDLTDTLVITAIVILNGSIGFVQELRSERAMAALRAMAAPSALVLRAGKHHMIAASDLVPGDTVVLEAGAIVPADIRLFETAALRVNESALTGESAPVDKSTAPISEASLAVGDRKNIAHKGTLVTYGRAAGVVVATGMRTQFGKIAQLLKDADAVRTPLQRRLAAFGRTLTIIVLLICVIVLATGLLRGEAAMPMFLTALSLAVAAIPESLPAVVTIALALGARKMLAHNALIRRLPAVETLGSLTFICSDKTGTLTANQMRVEQYYCDARHASSPSDTAPWKELLRAMAISQDAIVNDDGSFSGDPTEIALLRAAQDVGVLREVAESAAPRIAEVPFDSERKCMTTVHRLADGSVISITKGAAEVVVPACVCEVRAGGEHPANTAELLSIAEAFAQDGQRVLALAVRSWSAVPEHLDTHIERGLSFLGLIGMIDPPRVEAQQAIAVCKTAGIVPVLITGDHPATARVIAQRLGILGPDDLELKGAELAALSEQELRECAPRVRVYARVSPEQKLRIVTALQSRGEIVAMTGDGVNDAPALKRADIGVAMGITGTDVAKEASGIVLLDDDFATIVRAVREGRRIYDNVRRFVRYVLTTNSAEVWTIFLAPFLGLPVPLLPIQILWINLVTDGVPGLALASEPAERIVMQRPPRPPDESLMARGLGAHALLLGLFMAGLTLAAQAWYIDTGSEAWQTIALTTLCFAQLGHVLAVRSEHTSLFTLGLASNLPLLGAVLLTIALQLSIVYVPTLGILFKTVPLSLDQLLVCIGTGVLTFSIVEVEKWIRRRHSGPLRAAPRFEAHY